MRQVYGNFSEEVLNYLNENKLRLLSQEQTPEIAEQIARERELICRLREINQRGLEEIK